MNKNSITTIHNDQIVECKSNSVSGRSVTIAALISLLVLLLFNSVAFEITNSLTKATLDEFKRPTTIGIILHTIILFIILLLIINTKD